MTALLAASRLIDAATAFAGRHVKWAILAAILVSAGNAVLRKAFDATMADAEFNAEAVKLDLTVSPMTGQESEAQVAALYKASPQTLQAIAAMVRN